MDSVLPSFSAAVHWGVSVRGAQQKMQRAGQRRRLFSAALLLTSAWTAVSASNNRLCEGYYGENGHYHSGFYCPRLTDPSEHLYCCDPGNCTLKNCCSHLEFEALMKVNLSELLTTEIHRSPLTLLGVGFYGLLIFSMMVVDFLYFYKVNKHSFHDIVSQRRIGKYLLSSILHRDAKGRRHSMDYSLEDMTERATQSNDKNQV
ncbi:protein shisa-like-1 [Ambystoma mexicanum]|uniref:protein shisa-like-1 n=1 Tax=Ambystoma mexicanum TaxID=8296 RepID=UPI0037E81934